MSDLQTVLEWLRDPHESLPPERRERMAEIIEQAMSSDGRTLLSLEIDGTLVEVTSDGLLVFGTQGGHEDPELTKGCDHIGHEGKDDNGKPYCTWCDATLPEKDSQS